MPRCLRETLEELPQAVLRVCSAGSPRSYLELSPRNCALSGDTAPAYIQTRARARAFTNTRTYRKKKKKKETEGCHKAIGERSEREIRASGVSCVFVVRVRHSTCCWLASLRRCFAPGIVIFCIFCCFARWFSQPARLL